MAYVVEMMKKNLLKGIGFYLLPFIMMFIKIQFYDMHRLDLLIIGLGLRNHTRLMELIVYFLFLIMVFLLMVAYQKSLHGNGSVPESIRYSLSHGPKMIGSTLLYYLLFTFVASSISLFMMPLLLVPFGLPMYLIVKMIAITIIVFSLIVHLIAKMDGNKRYKNPFNVIFELKMKTISYLLMMVIIYVLAKSVMAFLLEHLINFRYTAIMQNYITIFSNGFLILLLIAVQNYSDLYYWNKIVESEKKIEAY